MENVDKIAEMASGQLFPEKSKIRYQAAYNFFKSWCAEKKIDVVNENVLLAFFYERSQTLKSPASMWSEYSMLKTTFIINENQDISNCPKLIAFLKRKSSGYKPKKSEVFTRQTINRFLSDAPDDIYLMIKVSSDIDFYHLNNFETVLDSGCARYSRRLPC